MVEVTRDDMAARDMIRAMFEIAPDTQTIAETVAEAFATHREAAAKAERDRIVAQIREEAKGDWNTRVGYSDVMLGIADALESKP